MAKITKTEEQLTKDLEAAMKKLYKTLPGTQEEKIQILRTKFESEIQQLIQQSQLEEHAKRAKEQSKKKEKLGPSKETTDIIDLLRHLIPHGEIAQKCGKCHTYISALAKKNGIWSPKAVKQLLKDPEAAKMTNQELAEKTGAYPEAIERIRKELEKGKQQAKKEKLNLEVRESASLEERGTVEAGDLRLPQESADEEVPAHMEELREIALPEEQNSREPERDLSHIWSSQKIREKLAQPETKRIPNAVWARHTGVDEETITRIREELERDKKNEEHLSSERIQQQTEPIEGQQQESGERAENTERLTTAKRW